MLDMTVEKNSETALKLLGKVVSDKKGGEDRPQQKRMVSAVCEAVDDHRSVMIEAGTGSGKSFAELIPAAVYADNGSRWIISTATIQLSEQIGKIDLPFLEKEIEGLEGTWSVLKGRSNYACLERISFIKREDEEAKGKQSLFEDGEDNGKSSPKSLPKESVELRSLLEWSESSETGDRGEAPAVSDKTWSRFSRTSGTCPGAKKCPFGDVCFAEKAISKAQESRIVVTNHALVAHDLDQRAQEQESVLGENLGVIVFDESHQLESYLSDAWGAEISGEYAKEVVSQVRSILGSNAKDAQNSLKTHLDGLIKAAVISCQKNDKKSLLINPGEKFPSLVQNALNVVNADISNLSHLNLHDDKAKSSMFRLTNMMSETIGRLNNDSEENVRWIEYDGMEWKKNAEPVARIRTAPLMIGPILSDITERFGITTIFTSATIQVDGGFEIPSTKLGVSAAEGVALGSPFDFPRQGILCIPDGIPVPKGEDREKHFDEFKDMSMKVVKALGGRTLILCTSKKNTVAMAEFLRSKGVKVIDTVNTPQSHATEVFKNDEESVLVGTYGVWQGLDVPGSSLQAVLIEKIPFNRMDDMLANARSNYWDSHGSSGFMLESIAGAQTRLNQAVGRLIRARTDRGVVVIADPRMRKTRYGKTLVNGLPPFYRLDDFDKVVASCKNLVGR